MTIYTLPHTKCIRLVSVRLSLPCINIVRMELTFKKVYERQTKLVNSGIMEERQPKSSFLLIFGQGCLSPIEGQAFTPRARIEPLTIRLVAPYASIYAKVTTAERGP